MKVLVKGSVAKVTQGNLGTLNRVLRCLNPRYNWERRTNPNVEKFQRFLDIEQRTFPAGLLPYARKVLRSRGIDIDAMYRKYGKHVKVDPKCLHNRTMLPHQVSATKIALKELRGILEVATGGGKTTIMAATICYLLERGIGPILVMVPSKGLLHQTARELSRFLGMDVGMMGDGRKQFDHEVTVGIPDTLRRSIPEDPVWSQKYRRMMPGKIPDPRMAAFIKNQKAIFMDEAHHGSADTWFKIAMSCPADVRLGFTGTADKKDQLSFFRLQGATGPILMRVKSKQLIEEGHLAVPRVFFINDRAVFGKWVKSKEKKAKQAKRRWRIPDPDARAHRPTRPWAQIYTEALVDNDVYNRNIALEAKKMISIGHPPLILALHIRHLRNIKAHMKALKVPAFILTGAVPVPVRESVVQRFVDSGDCALMATTIFDEGMDCPALSGLILAGGGKSRVKFIQRIGRGLRKKKDNNLVVIDHGHLNNKITKRHGEERLAECERQKWEVCKVEDIQRLFKTNMLRERAKQPGSALPRLHMG